MKQKRVVVPSHMMQHPRQRQACLHKQCEQLQRLHGAHKAALVLMCLVLPGFYMAGLLSTGTPSLGSPAGGVTGASLRAKSALAAAGVKVKGGGTSAPRRLNSSIPRIIHQSFKSHDLPPLFQRWSQTCKELNPGWKYMMHTDEDNLRLITEHYPEFLTVYKSYNEKIKRIDAARYFYLHHYGGVYMDLDFACLKPLDDVIDHANVVLAEDCNMSHPVFKGEKVPYPVGNSFMASAPHSNFMTEAIASLPKTRSRRVVFATGVEFVRNVNLYLRQKMGPRFPALRVKVMPFGTVTPMMWYDSSSWKVPSLKPSDPFCQCRLKDTKICNALYPNAYTVTFWSGVWKKGGDNSPCDVPQE